MLRQRTILVCLLLTVAAGSAHGQVVARVNGEEITKSEFGLALVRSLGRAALDSVVDRVLVEHEARRNGITVSDDEMQARLALEHELRMRALLDNARMGLEEFKRAAGRYDWDMEEVIRELRESVSPEAVRLKLLCEKMLGPELDLSEEAIRDYFERTRGLRYSAAHVALPDRSSAESVLRALKEDMELWTAAVVSYSLDRASLPHKGRLSPVPADSRLGGVLAGMEPDELRLHQAGDVWHVLRFIGTVAPEGEYEDLKEQMREELLAVRAQEQHYAFLARLNRDAAVVTNLSVRPDRRRALGEEVAAYVDGEPVLVEDLADALMQHFGRTMLESYMERVLVLQEARRRGLTVSPDEVDERTEAIAGQILGDAAFRQSTPSGEMEDLGADGEARIQNIGRMIAKEAVEREDVRATLLAEKMVAADVEVSEQEIEEAYDGYFADRFLVKEIAAPTAARAQRLRRDLSQGADFDLLLQAESGQTGSWLQSTALLAVTPSHPYYPYVKGLQSGQVSEIFKHGDAYRTVKVVRHVEAADPQPLEAVRDDIRRDLVEGKIVERIHALLIKLKAEADIQIEMELKDDAGEVLQPGA